jgi:hypothetical protein
MKLVGACPFVVALATAAGAAMHGRAVAVPGTGYAAHAPSPETVTDGRRLFFNGHYESAAALMLEPCFSVDDGLDACELRAAAVMFQIKKALGEAADKQKAWKQCVVCPELFAAFQTVTGRGQILARERIRTHPDDDGTLFLLGKLSLNHVWLQIGMLGRRTGWSEYWEGRRSLDKVLRMNPGHVRARVARAWIDYIVDTKVPRGTRWILGGGNKKRGLIAVREAADAPSDFFSQTEARFALWDMQVREKNLLEAMVTARTLARDFPENQELFRFIETHDGID